MPVRAARTESGEDGSGGQGTECCEVGAQQRGVGELLDQLLQVAYCLGIAAEGSICPPSMIAFGPLTNCR